MKEIELKFLVPESKVISLMRQVNIKSSDTTQLTAHYFDTADKVLAQKGVALRIRKEGEEWVQTIKSKGDGLATRVEQNDVLEPELVNQAIKTNSLLPDLSIYENNNTVKTLQKLKNSGKLEDVNLLYITDVNRITRLIKNQSGIIEVAYDVGVVTHGQNDAKQQEIHEIEFELLEGDVSFLFDTAKTWCKRYNLCLSTVTKAERGSLLLAEKEHSDATKASLKNIKIDNNSTKPEFMRAIIQNCIQHILPNASAIAAGSAESAHVHQLRVGIRRLRTVLDFFEGFSAQINPEWKLKLKQAFIKLGKYRDYEILQSQTQPHLTTLGAPDVDWSDEVILYSELPFDAVNNNDFQLTLLELIEYTMSDAALDSASDKKSLQRSVSKLINKYYKKICKACDVYETLDVDSQHDIRKQLKTLRYITEFVKPLYDKKRVKVFLKQLKPIQNILGDYNDDYNAYCAYLQKSATDANAWFAVGYYSSENKHVVKYCAASLQEMRNTPVYWRD